MSAHAIMWGAADRPIFIGGLMKSGTSLLRTLLGQHPEVFASFETHWYEDTVRAHWDDPTSRRMSYLLEFFEINQPAYALLCERKRQEPDREFLDILMAFAVERAGKLRWAEKTPGNLRHYSLIRRQWPTARFIHVTREYKDCFSSWKDKRGDTLDDFLAAATSAYDDLGDLLGLQEEHYLEIDYEQLVEDSENTMRRVLEFADLRWMPACAQLNLDATRHERDRVIEVTGRDSNTNISLARPIFTDSVGQWRRILTDDEARHIDRALAPYYAIFGDRWRHR